MAETFEQMLARTKKKWPPEPEKTRSIHEVLGDAIESGVRATQPASWDAHPGYAKGLADPLTEATLNVTPLGNLDATGEALREGDLQGVALGVMGGPASRLANYKLLSEAEHMLANGLSKKEILLKTGWMKDPEGNWNYEIPDHEAKIKKGALAKLKDPYVTLGDIYDHPKLFAAYPEVANLPLDTKMIGSKKYPSATNFGGFAQMVDDTGQSHGDFMMVNKKLLKEDPAKFLSTIIHESEHVLQKIEGRGANSATGYGVKIDPAIPGIKADMQEQTKKLRDIAERYEDVGNIEGRDRALAELKKVSRWQTADHAELNYKTKFKEWQARNAQERVKRDPDEVRTLLQEETADMFPRHLIGMNAAPIPERLRRLITTPRYNR